MSTDLPYGWVSRDGGAWEPVTLEGWCSAERAAGFQARTGCAATAGFSGMRIRGRLNKPVEDVLLTVDELLAHPETGVRREKRATP